MTPAPPYVIHHLTLEETVKDITPEFPYMANLCDLHHFPDSTFPWHWHKEVEFFYMREGELTYHLPSGIHHFKTGEGAFLNANVLHMTSSPKGSACVQEEHLFLPEFVGGVKEGIIAQKYILPIIQNSGLEIFRLNPDNPAHQEMITTMKKAYDLYNSAGEGYEFDLRQHMDQLWRALYTLTKDHHPQPTPNNVTIKAMMAYIALHYQEKITLQLIADSGYVSIRECHRCFHEQLGTSPFAYVMDYRLRKGCDLLTATDLTITNIALSCGFNSSSYFGKVFREKFGCSPVAFRKQCQIR